LVDITVIGQLNDFFAQWIEGEGQRFIYMQRYKESNNPFGMCTRCVDDRGKTITDRDCPDCFGTGFNGGYGVPVTGVDAPYQRCYGFTNTDKITTDWQKSGIVTAQQNQVIYMKVRQQPALSDLIIREADNLRYRVGDEVDDWSFNGQQIGYVITVFQMPPDDPAYNVQIPPLVNMSGRSSNALTQLKIYPAYQTKTVCFPMS